MVIMEVRQAQVVAVDMAPLAYGEAQALLGTLRVPTLVPQLPRCHLLMAAQAAQVVMQLVDLAAGLQLMGVVMEQVELAAVIQAAAAQVVVVNMEALVALITTEQIKAILLEILQAPK